MNPNYFIKPPFYALLAIILLLLFQPHAEQLQFERIAISRGELYRLVTAHFVHINYAHLLLNSMGLLLLCVVFNDAIKPKLIVGEILALTVLISVSLWLLFPHIEWYRGLSGLLHALAILYIIKASKKEKFAYYSLGSLLWLKVIYETVTAKSVSSSMFFTQPVITESHLLGVVFGTAMAIASYKKWSAK